MPDTSLIERLKERKLVQWALAYLAGGFVVFQLLDALSEPLGLTPTIQRGVLVIVGLGFFITLIIAWYHGEKGRQRVSGPELLMVAASLVVAGVALTLLHPREESYSPVALEGDDRPAIAVFPCENWSPDPTDAYFASGIHDEILLHLHKISGLRSIGRESMEWYKANPLPMREMARDLGVGFLGECSVLKDVERNQIRLTFQLLDGSTGTQIWADNYDEDLSARSIFDIHSDVARRVAQAVGAAITPEEEARIERYPTEDTKAFDEYLIGRSWLKQRTEESFRRALQHFEAAAEADDAFAPAYIGMADAYALLGSYRHLPSQEAFSSAKEWAERALEIDPALGEAYASLGYIQYRFDWDFASAFRNLRRAVELSPNYAQAYLWYGVGLSIQGREEEGLPLVERALSLDPLDFNIRRVLGSIYAGTRAYDRAVEQVERALAINPGYPPAQAELGQILILMGNHEAGLLHLEEANEGQNGGRRYVLLLAWAHATSGRESEAREMLERTLADPTQRAADPVAVARVYTGLGEPDSAFEWLERGYESRSPGMAGIGNSAAWDSLRGDPRFEDLLVRLGLSGR